MLSSHDNEKGLTCTKNNDTIGEENDCIEGSF